MARIVWQKPADFDSSDPMAEQVDLPPDAVFKRVGVSQSGYAAIVVDHETGDQVLYVGDAESPPSPERCTVVDWLVEYPRHAH